MWNPLRRCFYPLLIQKSTLWIWALSLVEWGNDSSTVAGRSCTENAERAACMVLMREMHCHCSRSYPITTAVLITIFLLDSTGRCYVVLYGFLYVSEFNILVNIMSYAYLFIKKQVLGSWKRTDFCHLILIIKLAEFTRIDQIICSPHFL